MRIVHLCDYIQPQLGYQEYYLAREHARMGHDVTVIASDRYFPFPDYENTVGSILGPRIIGQEDIQLDGFRLLRLKTVFEIGTKVWLKGLPETVRNIKPELVICHGMSDFNVLRAILLKKQVGFKLISDDHGLFSEKKKGIIGLLFYNLYPFKMVMEFSDRLVGVAEECIDFIEQLYRFPRDKIEMIPLGADSDKFRFSEEARADFRNEHRIREEEVLITYTGKLTFRKGPHHIFNALTRLKKNLTRSVVLLFVGNMAADYKNFFQSQVENVQNIVRVIVLPAVKNDELVSIYSASDMAVWPRQGSMSMIEAASCGCPIVCCDFLSERCKNDNGLLIVEDDLESLQQAMLTMIENNVLRSNMGKRARELVEKELSWRVIAERFLT